MFYAVDHQPSEISEYINSHCGFPKYAEVSLTKYMLQVTHGKETENQHILTFILF